jgi:hypothetical protein
MITVIVPTMWKGKEINVMLPQLNDHPLVGEIIIIDNAPLEKVEETCSLSKVSYKTFGKNIYPVPSWNYGAANAKHDKLLIINDDVVFSIALVDAIYDMITEQNGTITLDSVNVMPKLPDMSLLTVRKPAHIKFVECKRLLNKAAVVIGIHKNSYEHIPEELLIHFNDYFLFKKCEVNNKPNWTATGLEARTDMSTTVKEFPEITGREIMTYPGIFDRHGIKDKIC